MVSVSKWLTTGDDLTAPGDEFDADTDSGSAAEETRAVATADCAATGGAAEGVGTAVDGKIRLTLTPPQHRPGIQLCIYPEKKEKRGPKVKNSNHSGLHPELKPKLIQYSRP